MTNLAAFKIPRLRSRRHVITIRPPQINSMVVEIVSFCYLRRENSCETCNCRMSFMVPVLLAGGQGSRLWPLSTPSRPKQFLRLGGGESLIRQAARRALMLTDASHIITVLSAHHADMTQQELGLLHPDLSAHLLAEPHARNTAAASMLAALHALEHWQDPVLCLMPCDHVIEDPDTLARAVGRLLPLAAEGRIGVLGLRPAGPQEKYGYICAKPEREGTAIFEVTRFHEKPVREQAIRYIAAGHCYWNSGLYVLRASTLIGEMRAYQPSIHAACVEAYRLAGRAEATEYDLAYAKIPPLSIDKAISEHSGRLAVTPLDCEIRDIGTWDCLLAYRSFAFVQAEPAEIPV